MAIWYSAYFLTGCFLGGAFYYIFNKIVRPGVTRDFFRALGTGIKGMLSEDVSDFWRYFFSIIKHSLFFACIQFFGVMLALCPIILTMLFVNGPVQSHFNRRARLFIYPEYAGKIHYQGEKDGGYNPPMSSQKTVVENTPFALLTLEDGQHIRIEDPFSSHVLCGENRLLALFLGASGFKVIPVETTELIIVRPLRGNHNPFWPYLNDLDLLFIIGLIVSNLTLVLSRRYINKPTKDLDFEMGFVDYILTWIATSNMSLMKTLGELENKILQRKLEKKAIEKPIFVSGLARSGTTILLETFSGSDRTASHLYKDFPFIMTPVLWNFFTKMFSFKQKAVERPHKDRIKITRESPDAFEEPIWQYFFPQVHDPFSTHVLGLKHKKPDFDQFYINHIRKIMTIRKGERYLSKGNYNFTRFEYICSIFRDAKFIIPIRHPLFHVDSLIRQHKLFLSYSEGNQQVPEYLKAVGHYEFGPQRIPTIFSEEAGARIIAEWDAGRDSIGYAIQWAEVYKFVMELLRKEEYAENIRIVRYEDLCAAPYEELSRILRYIELHDSIDAASAAEKISPNPRSLSIPKHEIDLCWQQVEQVAKFYGYNRDLDETETFS